MNNGWALPRIATIAMLVIGAAQTALSVFGVIHWTYHGVDLTPYVNILFAVATQFSHSTSLAGFRLPPWFGPIAALLATVTGLGIPAPAGTVISFLSLWAGSISKAVTNVTPLPAPQSNTVSVVTPGTPRAEVQ